MAEERWAVELVHNYIILHDSEKIKLDECDSRYFYDALPQYDKSLYDILILSKIDKKLSREAISYCP